MLVSQAHRDIVGDFIADSFNEYVTKGARPGGFLTYCLENDFVRAVCAADLASLRCIDTIARIIYNDLPSPCWGSKEKVAKWKGLDAVKFEEESE